MIPLGLRASGGNLLARKSIVVTKIEKAAHV
jgi:hypothetical protein